MWNLKDFACAKEHLFSDGTNSFKLITVNTPYRMMLFVVKYYKYDVLPQYVFIPEGESSRRGGPFSLCSAGQNDMLAS